MNESRGYLELSFRSVSCFGTDGPLVATQLGGLIGMPADIALAVSLAIRIREIIFDVPGLVFWQHMEGRALLHRRRAAAESAGLRPDGK